jgi:hypothetical protein
MKLLVAALCAVALACAACNETVPPPPSVGPSTITDAFTGSLAVGGANTHPVVVQQVSRFVVTLVSVDPPIALGILVGSLSNGVCVPLTTNAAVQPGSNVAISGTALAGTFCVQVSDIGNVVDTATYTITVAHS